MIWILALLSLGFLAGVVGALLNNSPLKYALASGREYAAAPICIYAAYRLFPATQSAMKLIYALILGGTVTAIFLVLNFGENAEMAGFRDNINLVRSVNFVSSYAGLACLILVYTMTDRRFKVLPTPVAATVAAFCLVGQFATLHRTDWLHTMACFSSLFVIMPKGKRMIALVRVGLSMPVLLATLWLSVALASAAMHRDFGEKIKKRFYSLLPTERYSSDDKAWDSRLPGIILELNMWKSNMLFGGGFAAQEGHFVSTGTYNYGANHNGWASVLAKTGVFGFIGSQMVWICMLLVGYKLLRDSPDKGTALIGLATFMGGVMLFIGVVATMIWTSRSAMLFGTLLGVAFKLRDLQTSPWAVRQEERHFVTDDAAYPPVEFG